MVTTFGLDNPERKNLEMGSQNVNGSVRGFFGPDYVGIDHAEGSGVDMVASTHAAPFPDDTFHTVISTEMLEHDPNPRRSIEEAARLLKPGGLLLLTCRGNGFSYHCPPDYWRFHREGVGLLLHDAGFDAWQTWDDVPDMPGVLAVAMMPD